MTDVLMARMIPTDRRGVPLRDGRAATIGATADLGDGERVWFRVRTGTGTDPLGPDPVIVEVRPGDRAARAMRTAAAAYTDRGWIPAATPAAATAPEPPVHDRGLLRAWASDRAEQARTWNSSSS